MTELTNILVIAGVVFAFFLLRYLVQEWYISHQKREEEDRIRAIRHALRNPYIIGRTPSDADSRFQYSSPTSYDHPPEYAPPPSFEFAVKSASPIHIPIEEPPPTYAEIEETSGGIHPTSASPQSNNDDNLSPTSKSNRIT